MIPKKLDDVSVLIQSCESGFTAFMKRTASPTCCFGDLVVNDKHVVTIVNYDWLSLQRFGSSREICNEI